MPFQLTEYACVGTNIVYLNQQVLTCIDGRLNEIWKCSTIPAASILTPTAVIVAYGKAAIQCIDKNGAAVCHAHDGQVQSARAGINKVAVYVKQVLKTKRRPTFCVRPAGNSLYQIDVAANTC